MTSPYAGEVSCIWQAERLLGEGAWWSIAEQSLYWVDIKRPAILRYTPAQDVRHEWPSPEPIGCFIARVQGGFVGAFQSSICTFELGEPGKAIRPTPIAKPSMHRGSDRFNDGKCHPDGSLWTGTMDDAEREIRGYFYRLSPNHQLKTISGPHTVCNGPAFSPDGRIAYLTDSALRIIYRMDLHRAGAPPEALATFTESDGHPDGMTTDSEGRLWIAFWDGWKVMCLTPSGERIAEIRLPVSRPTSCAFGGEDLSTLYITSASINLTPDEAALQPLSGSLFACPVKEAKGWPAPVFCG